jgi:uncharacterized membrane protein HdeD (DUF308 family)
MRLTVESRPNKPDKRSHPRLRALISQTEIQLKEGYTMTDTPAQSGLDFAHAEPHLLGSLAKSWWLLLLRGIAAIAFGFLAFAWPGLTLLTLTLLWGAYAVSDGILALWAAVAAKGGDIGLRWWLALAGIVSCVAGVMTFFWPGMTTLVLLMFMASWAIIIGALQIWGAIELREEPKGEWLLALNGLLSIAFGVIMFAQPGAGALAVAWMIGCFAILAGCLYIALALRLKKYK